MLDKLLPDEPLALGQETQVPSGAASDEEISARYTSGEIRIVTDQGRTQLADLPSVLESGRWELQPEYQRRARWNNLKQSRLIESFIMNVPVPPVFLYEYEYSKYEVMDGLQRLSALRSFYANELILTDLEYWQDLEGRTYDTLPLQLRQGIDRRYLSSIVLLYETSHKDVNTTRLKELVFERINTGGERLTPQESRNAVSNGPLNEILPILARTPSFCRLWRIPEPDPLELSSGQISDEVLTDERYRSMEDVEMVLRFFAHRQRGAVSSPRRLRPFLDIYWTKGNEEFSRETVNDIGAIFVQTSNLIEAVLGERAFYIRRERNGERSWVPRPTLLAYDSTMAAFSHHLANADKLKERKDVVAARLQALYDSHSSSFDGRRTDPTDLAERDSLIKNVLDGVVKE